MNVSIGDYQNRPGEHCGSVAMRGLLQHYCDLDLPEPAVFGLGSGLACVYLTGPDLDPAHLVFGRTISMEADLAENLQVDYREETEADDDVAWEKARAEVVAGRPTMLSGDILYLDYREYKVHFPGHRFVLLGFDDATEKAQIADRINVAPELCSYGALRKSRNPKDAMSTNNLWGKFHGTEVGRSLVDASRVAIDRCAKSMLETTTEQGAALSGEFSMKTGVAAIRQLAAAIPEWGGRADAAWIASYNARCIEKFGNGGGNFRRLYAGFLTWAHALDASLVPAAAPAQMLRAADGWTALSETLGAASKEGATPDLWPRAGVQASEVADLEERVFRSLL
ncbi:MAG: BtrH N-terminal domain-containing protein [Candidatus Binatia bacterium]|nr:BtrH N-terminal domain-containing protein [Candidatus Binatia bacterium]